jgi:hypothetical protein
MSSPYARLRAWQAQQAWRAAQAAWEADPRNLEWVDELDAAMRAHDIPRVVAAQAALRQPTAVRPRLGIPTGGSGQEAVRLAPLTGLVAPTLEQRFGPRDKPTVTARPDLLDAPAGTGLHGAYARRKRRTSG